MLAIAWEYVTGRAIATDPTDRERPEWPPHPDRVLQALVAAWGEAGCDPRQAAALEWLMEQAAPDLAVPLDVSAGARSRVFVPVNDTEGPSTRGYTDTHLQLLPSQRKRLPRLFPATNVGGAICALVWPAADGVQHLDALASLCSQATHIGHSSSLVRMWPTEAPPDITLRPNAVRGDFMLRVSGKGRFQALVNAFSGGSDGWRRPPVGRWQRYEAVVPVNRFSRSEFDDRMFMLRFTGGVQLSLKQGPAVVQAARGLLIAGTDRLARAKRLVSGHEEDGSPLEQTHAAIAPLAFVGDPRSAGGGRFGDGHLLGLGIAMPRDLTPEEEQELLLGIAGAFRKDGAQRSLHLGAAGSVEVTFDSSESPPHALRAATWCTPSATWGTVTPIALDRSPPRRHQDADAWVIDQIAASCIRQGIEAPAVTEVLCASPFLGAPTVAAFPPLLRKDGTRRMHVHARLRFSSEVVGPLILGAGRYRGYGLCRPLSA